MNLRTVATLLMIIAFCVISISSSICAEAQEARKGELNVDSDRQLDKESYSDWRAHILPTDAELAWKTIPWQTSFKDAILLAHEQKKPVLLWTMNGHPLGCT